MVHAFTSSVRRRGLVLTLAGSVVFVALRAQPQSGGGRHPSAREVVELFGRMDARGERLTKEGWLKVAALFLRPTPLPKGLSFTISDYGRADEAPAKGSHSQAEVWTMRTDWGTVDSMARFSTALGRMAGSSEPAEGPTVTRSQYTLVYTDTYWELTRDGGSLKQVKGKAAWRIDSFDPGPQVGTETALQYLAKLSQSSPDPLVRKNAARSITAIKRLRRTERPL